MVKTYVLIVIFNFLKCFINFSTLIVWLDFSAHKGFCGFLKDQFVLSKGFDRKFHMLIIKLSASVLSKVFSVRLRHCQTLDDNFEQRRNLQFYGVTL